MAAQTSPVGAAVLGTSPATALIERLHELATTALPRMYRPSERLFVFTERAEGGRLVCAGRSERYSAIALIGLESTAQSIAPFDRSERRAIAETLIDRVATSGLGDAALIGWAAALAGVAADAAWSRINALAPAESPQPTVELAWTLAALSIVQPANTQAIRQRVAERLMAAYAWRARLFPHAVGSSAIRSHVTCFADQVYPIQALSEYARAGGHPQALAIAADCAARIGELQGPAGQWWWHYDARTGTVLEEYPVYAIHQDAMAPMALFALSRAGGPQHDLAVTRGLEWLTDAPELDGSALIDASNATVWRKVARREPNKASRYLHAAASRCRAGSRIPGLGWLFPPGVVDCEDRPYHWGWFLYAWASRQRQVA
jgi:hypothetical protein